METVSRGYLEMAEGAWAGSMRAFARFIQTYEKQLESLAGTDEHWCEVCGAGRFSDDGLRRVNGIFVVIGNRAWCEAHKDSIDG